MEKTNICRAITLYNNFLPADKSVHDWKYCAFGVVDGIYVGDVLEEKDIPKGIWKEQCELADKLDGEYVAQQVYILKYDFLQKEKAFWSLDDQYPFLFFMRIQCGENKEYLWENVSVLENALCVENKIKASVYLTLDNADLFIILRSKFYEQGVGMIDSLYSNNNMSFNSNVQCTLKNSFTVFAIKHSWIDDLNKDYFTEEAFIKEVLIKVIKKENGNIESIKNEIETRSKLFIKSSAKLEVERNTILGIDDDLISIKNISWYDFLGLYKNEDGIFCNWLPLYQENIAATTTIIKTDAVNYTSHLKENGLVINKDLGESDKKTLEEIYKKQIKVLSDKLKKYEKEAKGLEGLKELKLIINVLPKFAGEIFNDYIFFPIISPLNALLDILNDKEIKKKDKESFFKFLKGFSMYVQDSVRLDKHSMQALDFNTKIYDIPCKLNAFYYALIYNINKILSVPAEDKDDNKPHEYEFLTVPGLTQVEEIHELYVQASKRLRLMEIEMPERNYYNIHDMMIILAHELAHYIGGKYRKRKERYDLLISSYSHVYIAYIRNALLNYDIELTQDVVELLERRAKNLIISAMERDLNEDFVCNTRIYNIQHCEDIKDKNLEYKKHFFTFLKIIDITMTDIVDYGLDDIFSPILYDLEEEDRCRRQKIIKAVSEKFIYKSVATSTVLNSQSTLGILKILYEECFADLMAILLLNISIKDYINTIINSAKQQGMSLEKLLCSDVMYRVVVVLVCVVTCKVNEYDEDNILRDISVGTDEYRVIESAFKRWNSMENTDKNKYTSKDYRQREYYVYKDNIVLDNVCHYLILCCEEYMKDIDILKNRKEDLKNIFNIFSYNLEESIEKKITKMVEFIEEYRKDVLYELDEKNKTL